MHDIHAMDYVPKPDPSRLCRRSASATASIPARALFADDMVRNLAPAKALGMTTVWIDNGSEQGPRRADPRLRRLSDRRYRAAGSHEMLGEEVA